MDTYEKQTRQIDERLFVARYSFWSGMLTAHTVLLSVAVSFIPNARQIMVSQFKLVGGIAILCMVFVLLCFALTKGQYEAIGQRLTDSDPELTETGIWWANTRFTLIKVFETASAMGLSVAAVLFGWVLLTAP